MGVGSCGPDRYFISLFTLFSCFFVLAGIWRIRCRPHGLFDFAAWHRRQPALFTTTRLIRQPATGRKCRWEVGVDGGKQCRAWIKGNLYITYGVMAGLISEAFLVVVYTYIRL